MKSMCRQPWNSFSTRVACSLLLENALNEIGDAIQAVENVSIPEKIGERNVSRLAELLAVPDEIVVQEDFRWEMLDRRRLGEQQQFHASVQTLAAAHAVRQIQRIRPAFGQVVRPVSEEVTRRQSARDERLPAVFRELTETRNH